MIVDLRSDTVTQPNATMRTAMLEAKLGDDVFGDDPTVKRLETLAAEMMEKEAALFACSGTQSNLMALLSHCQRGDEYIAGQQFHTYKFEGGGAAVLGSIQPQPLEEEPDGSLDLAKVARTIKPDDFHFARTTLFCLENTHGGKVLPLDYIREAAAFAKSHRLALHLDGARAFNAAVKLNVPITEITQHFDSISICLSKGLAAPVGSVLCGSKELIGKARRWRKVLGGGLRQSGILAAAGIVALEQQTQRLAEDHENAQLLGSGLREIQELSLAPIQTNMVFVTPIHNDSLALAEYLKKQGIFIIGSPTIRMVVHQDVTKDGILKTIELIKQFYASPT